jgi:hypothetical protein
MCFFIDFENFPKPKVAEENIPIIKTVYLRKAIGKRGHTRYASIVQRSLLYLGKQKAVELDIRGRGVFQGYHSYHPNGMRWAKGWQYDHIIAGYIPKGSEYMYNKASNEYVSTNIVLTNKIVYDNTSKSV